VKTKVEWMHKATPTTGRFRTLGVNPGATMASLNSKSRMATVFAALISTEFTGPTGTFDLHFIISD